VRAQVSADFHYNLLLSQPMRLELLLGIFAGSQFLSDALVRNPGFLDWVVAPEVLHKLRETRDIEEELRRTASGCSSHGEWLNRLRRLRRREMLRIGIRDICLGASTREVMLELSRVAEAFAQAVLEKRIQEHPEWKDRFCILALGKLGGHELNYSSILICSASGAMRKGTRSRRRKPFLPGSWKTFGRISPATPRKAMPTGWI